MAATFEIDSSRLLVRQFGKDRYVKNLDYYIKERESMCLPEKSVEDIRFQATNEGVEDDERTKKISRLRRFSQLIPSKLWDLLAVMWLHD